jgi:hypothetical protein
MHYYRLVLNTIETNKSPTHRNMHANELICTKFRDPSTKQKMEDNNFDVKLGLVFWLCALNLIMSKDAIDTPNIKTLFTLN